MSARERGLVRGLALPIRFDRRQTRARQCASAALIPWFQRRGWGCCSSAQLGLASLWSRRLSRVAQQTGRGRSTKGTAWLRSTTRQPAVSTASPGKCVWFRLDVWVVSCSDQRAADCSALSPVAGLNLTQICKLIKGAEGTSLTVHITRTDPSDGIVKRMAVAIIRS